mmetsp:Transcript_11536/g.15059  ORF Transcript_11536/g.15059 Transcript_11536/m.15059 type:complete len:93 (+) Transcript_11536:556-834(+)
MPRKNIRHCSETKQKHPKQKFTASIAANLMKIVGTEDAQRKFPEEEYMQATPNRKPRFNWSELVSKYEIKAYFGRQQQQKKKERAVNAGSMK